MSEDEISLLRHQLTQLRRTMGLMILMIVLLVAMLVYSDLVLYSMIREWSLEWVFFHNFTFILALFTLVCFFAVMVAATVRSE